jgi:hypothetical protein
MITDELVLQLRKLKELKDEGLITEAEFAASKAQVLNLPPLATAAVVAAAVDAQAVPSAVARVAVGRPVVATGVSLVLSDCGSRGVMVVGDTLRAKAQLKAMGGRWDKALTAWMLCGKPLAEWRSELKGKGMHVRVEEGAEGSDATDPIARREAELRAEKESTLAAGAAANAGARLVVSRHKRAILVSGDTVRVKDMLRALDGMWISSLGGYCHPGSKLAEVLAALRADPSNEVTEQLDRPADADEPRSAKRRKGKAARGTDGDGFIDDREEDDFSD